MIYKPYKEEEQQRIQARLDIGLDKSDLKILPGKGRPPYVEGWRVIDIANDIFGFNGWNSEIRSLEVDFIDEIERGNGSKGFYSFATCTMRITLLDGSYHEDVGTGDASNLPNRGDAIGTAKKKAVTDALKRTIRTFGKSLGNSFYDNQYVKNLAMSTVNSNKPLTNHGSSSGISADGSRITRNVAVPISTIKVANDSNALAGNQSSFCSKKISLFNETHLSK